MRRVDRRKAGRKFSTMLYFSALVTLLLVITSCGQDAAESTAEGGSSGELPELSSDTEVEGGTVAVAEFQYMPMSKQL